MGRCINQQPTSITFSKREHLKFEDHHMNLPLPIRVYADFDYINQQMTLKYYLNKFQLQSDII